MKKILIFALIVTFIFLIYLGTIDKKVFYLSLGDEYALGKTTNGNYEYSYADHIKEYLKEKQVLETYIKEYAKNNYRITDLIKDIEENKKIVINKKPQTIKNALIKADLVTISIGTNDIIGKLNMHESYSKKEIYDFIDDFLLDLDQLYKLIRMYCKEDIIIIGYYNFLDDEKLDEVFNYLNQSIKLLSSKYNMETIDMNQNFIKYHANNQTIYPNKEGYYEIYQKIKKLIDIKIFNHN